jgi:hypothetical protein
MKVFKISLVVVLALLVGLAIMAPIGPLPGLFIGGQPAAAVAQWSDTSMVHEIKLRVPGTLWQDVLNAYVEKYRNDYPDVIAGFPSVEDAKGSVAVYRLARGT